MWRRPSAWPGPPTPPFCRTWAGAFGYNLVAIPLAAAGVLNPVVAGAAMGLSSVSVVANSLRLYRFGRGRAAPAGAGRRRRGVALAWLVPAVALVAVALVARTGDGEPQVDRVVEVGMSELAFTPATFTARTGERVRFVFHNDGKAVHEAVIGDAAVQEEHARAMAGDGHGGHNAHATAAVEVAPGETASLVYRFDRPGDVLIGCHEPGHYQLGMRAIVEVEPPL